MLKIPKDAKITINAKGTTLKGDIEFSDKSIITLDNVTSINTVLHEIYETELITFGDLIRSGRVIIGSSKVWEKYDLIDKGYFSKIATKVDKKTVTTDSTVEPKKEESSTKEAVTESHDKEDAVVEVVEDVKEDKKEKKEKKDKKITLKSIGKKAIIALMGLGVVYYGGKTLVEKLTKKATTNKYRVEVNEENSHAYNATDEEIMQNIMEEAMSDEERYAHLGSSISYDEMAKQLEVIDDMALKNQPFQFENLVVSDDYDAIYALNSMRINAINGNNNSKRAFMNTIVKYTFDHQNYVNGSFIEDFDNLHPYARYIVIRMSQGVLQTIRDYDCSTDYAIRNFDSLSSEYNNIGDSLYRELNGITYGK